MAIELYGIRQNLGICKTFTEGAFVDLPEIAGINAEKYKKFKKFNIEGGVEVFRGMAEASLLSRISSPIKDYQRGIDEHHKQKLHEYLLSNDPDSIYFPEITLLYEFDDGIKPEDLNIQSIIKSHEDNKDIDLLAKLYSTGVSILTLQDNEKLYRLDGNHRLTVLQEFADGVKKNSSRYHSLHNTHTANHMISYCIILVPKTKEFTFEHLYFYLLNSKSLPITPLKNIDLLINDSTAKELEKFIKTDPFLNIMNELKVFWIKLDTHEKECLINIVKELLDQKASSSEIIKSCSEGIGMYQYHKENNTNSHKYIGVCCILRHYADSSNEAKKKLELFRKWVSKFNLDLSHFSLINDLYESFIKHQDYISRQIHIFVAMQYNQEYVKIYTDAINNAITNLKGKYSHINLELIEIMDPNDGENIITNIMDIDIPKCDIFIADLSTNNGNVLLEYGYAKAQEKFMCLLYSKEWRNKTLEDLKNCDLDNNPSVNKFYNDLKHNIFDLRVIKNTEWASQDILEDLLKVRLEKYIKEKTLD